MIQFKTITAKETIELRHRVLWPDKQRSDVILPKDAQGLHFGAVIENTTIAVASVFTDQTTARLRKFAIDPDYQRQGIGSKMIKHIQKKLLARGLDTLWCDARETALPFYRSLGFQIDGDRFLKSGVAYFNAKLAIFPLFGYKPIGNPY